MAESVPDVQTTSQEDSVDITSSDQAETNHEEETKTFPTFGFDVKTQKTDLTLIFGKHRLYVRRSFLEDASPVLEGLFEEKLTGKTNQEVVIDDVSCEDFAEFLACIQWRGRRKISKENAFRMLVVASKYEIEDLKERCEFCFLDILNNEKSDPMAILRLLKVATDYDLVALKSSCIENADERALVSLQERNETIGVPSNVRFELLGKFSQSLISKSFVLDCLKTGVSSEHAAKLDEFQNATGLEFKCTISAGSSFTEEIKLWDSKWTVKIVIPYNSSYCFQGVFSLSHNDNSAKQLKAKVAMAVRIRNNIPKKKDRFGIEILTYESKQLSWSFLDALGVTSDEYSNQTLGFRWDGKFTLDAYLLMNKPE